MKRRLIVALTLALLVALASSCAATVGGGPGGVGSAPTMELWAVGDSISVGYSGVYPGHITTAAVSGSSFVYTGLPGYKVGTIGQNTATLLQWWGQPETVVLMGGVNDVRYDISLERIQSAIVDLTDGFASGTRVVHVTEPNWGIYTPKMTALNQWLLATYPDTIDCASQMTDLIWTSDGVHPVLPAGADRLARCVKDGLAALGLPEAA